MSRKIAIDVVLLPEEKVTALAIEANKILVRKFGEKIVLDRSHCLPHISLFMGCIDDGDIPTAGEVLQKIASDISLDELIITGLHIAENSRGEAVSAFQIDATPQLQTLHEQIMNELLPLTDNDVTAEMLVNPEEVEQLTLMWIKNYRDKSSFENFLPHITIGYGQATETDLPVKFTASKLAICHLGNHCTCREVLWSVELQQK
jgi:2'-5' RNA ligase